MVGVYLLLWAAAALATLAVLAWTLADVVVVLRRRSRRENFAEPRSNRCAPRPRGLLPTSVVASAMTASFSLLVWTSFGSDDKDLAAATVTPPVGLSMSCALAAIWLWARPLVGSHSRKYRIAP